MRVTTQDIIDRGVEFWALEKGEIISLSDMADSYFALPPDYRTITFSLSPERDVYRREIHDLMGLIIAEKKQLVMTVVFIRRYTKPF